MSRKTDRCWCRFILEIKTLPSDLPDCYHDRCAPSSDAARCSAAYLVFGADRLGRAKLQQLNRCSIVKYERNSNSNRWLGRCDQNLPTFEGFVQIVDGEGDVRNNPDNLGHVAMRLEPDPLDPVGTGLKTGDVNPELPDMMLPSTRLCVWNPDMVVPPSELRCHGRRLMVQSLSASQPSLIPSNPLPHLEKNPKKAESRK